MPRFKKKNLKKSVKSKRIPIKNSGKRKVVTTNNSQDVLRFGSDFGKKFSTLFGTSSRTPTVFS